MSMTKDELLTRMNEDEDDAKNLPPLVPVKTKKSDIVKDVNMFKAIDDNARNTVRLSVDKLVAHLCKGAATDLEKVRAFYVWICTNISKNIEEDDAKPLKMDAVSTLRHCKGSHVALMTAFCEEVSIPVVTISGCSTGLRNPPDKEFATGEHNHSWNAVYIDGEWRFLDCTWGSGFIDSSGKFHNRLDDYWFITDPEVFAYDHFPANPAWQLLEKPIDIGEFNKKPNMTTRSRELGFKLLTHREPIIYVQNEVSILFGTETFPLYNITAEFCLKDGEKVNSHRCIRRLDDKTFEVRVVPPQTGEYALLLYGRSKNYIHAKYKMLLEYTLRVESVYPEKVAFPDHDHAWGPEPNYAECGFSNSINKQSVFKTETNEMTICLEQTTKNIISPKLKGVTELDGEFDDFTMVSANKKGAVVHCRFPTSGYYSLNIYAVGPNTERLEHCASFLIECTSSDTPKTFPKYNYSSVSKHECELLEPMYRELPSDSLVTFRLRSAGLRQAGVGIIRKNEKYDTRRIESLGEIQVNGDIFSGEIRTPEKGQTVSFYGSAAPPNIFMSMVYEFITV